MTWTRRPEPSSTTSGPGTGVAMGVASASRRMASPQVAAPQNIAALMATKNSTMPAAVSKNLKFLTCDSWAPTTCRNVTPRPAVRPGAQLTATIPA